MNRKLFLTTVSLSLAWSCVHSEGVPTPPPDPCASYEQPDSPIRRPYSGPQWVVGVGHASGVLSVAELKEKADASAASDVASQLLVRVQATLDVDERSSSEFGSTTSVQSTTRTEVAATDLPGLKWVGSCHNPWNLTTVSIAVLHKGEARDVMVRQMGDDARTMEGSMSRAQESLESGAVLEAMMQLRGLSAVDERRRVISRLASTLGDTTPRSGPTEQLAALRAALAERKTAVVFTGGEGSVGHTFQQPEWVGAALTQSGWRINPSGPAALKVLVTLGTCALQNLEALGAYRARCPVEVALSDFSSGQVLRSFQVGIEGVGTDARRAVTDALRKSAASLQGSTARALVALEQGGAEK